MAKKKKSSAQRARVGSSRNWRKPSVKVLYLVIFAAVFMLLGHYLFPSHALTYPYVNSTAASSDRTRIANYRASKGYTTLSVQSCLNTIASNWAKHEASVNAISEPSGSWLVGSTGNGGQFKTYCNKYWLAYGANDGVGPTESDIFTAFLNSCPHLQNIADHGTGSSTVRTPNGAYCTFKSVAFKYVGVGAWVGSSGKLFVSQIYFRW